MQLLALLSLALAGPALASQPQCAVDSLHDVAELCTKTFAAVGSWSVAALSLDILTPELRDGDHQERDPHPDGRVLLQGGQDRLLGGHGGGQHGGGVGDTCTQLY